MALFGVQLVVTMVMASVLQKFSGHFSFARWLLSYRLVRYLHPSDEELRTLAGIPKNSGKGKDRRNSRRNDFARKNSEENSFLVPKNLDINLDSSVVKPYEMMQLRFYSEYQWLMDFALCTVLVYLATEFYYFLISPKNEVNLSMLWCMLVIGFTMKILFSLTALYFRGEEPIGERSICLTSGFFFFVVAMVVLITDENLLEFGLESAYVSFNESAYEFLQNQGLNSSGPASHIMFKFTLAIWCGIMATFLTFPGLRFARMHHDSLKYSEDNPVVKLFLHISFVAPLAVVLLWVKPVARDYFTEIKWPGMAGTLMQPPVFETTRLLTVIGVVLVRLLLMPRYLQSYLNIAHEKLNDIRKQAGRISNVELQKTIARVYYYLCVVTLQYVTPMLLCLFTTFLLKTLGGYTWSSLLWAINADTCSAGDEVNEAAKHLKLDSSILESSQQFSLALNSLKQVFNPVLYRGVLGFMTWWLCMVWFSTSTMGLFYCSYMQ